MGGQLNTLRALSQLPCGSHDPKVAAAAPSVTHNCDNKQRWQRGEGSAPRAPARVNVPPTPEQATHLLQANHCPRRCVAPAWLRPVAFHPSELGPPPLKVLHSEQNKRSKAGVGGQPARSTVATKESHPLSHCHEVPGERSKL